MRVLPLFLAFPLAIALLAGCLEDGKGPSQSDPGNVASTSDPWPMIQSIMADVPCEATSGGDTSSNLLQLGNVSYGEEAGIHGELDIHGDLALQARYSTGGFEIIDLSDPRYPLHLGYFSLDQNEGALDVKFSPDNATALYGTGSGIVMVDIRDPLQPTLVGMWNRTDAQGVVDPVNLMWNAHMLYTARIADRDWVFLAPNTGSGVWILEMTGAPEARELTYVTQTLAVEGGPLGPHDMFVTQDSVDGHWYLYSSDGFHGWTAFNVDDPAAPTVVGGIANPAEGAYTHSIQAQWVNGRRLVATIGEIGANALKVYDATILAAPVLLGAWQASPGEGSTQAEHNFNMVGGRVFLSYYNYGMFIIDLNALSGLPVVGTAELTPVGHWGNFGEAGTGPANIWDTLVKDGVIYLSDIEGGLFVVGYGCHAVPDPTLTSTG
ncbi:MAG: LVIVD repeat-containing protein [Thermoplasmatota archaeon]